MDKTKKGDFIELEFTGSVKGGDIFDTNIKEDAKKINLNLEGDKPLIICIGQGMVLPGFDKALENKDTSKKYSIELQPKEAFGQRDRKIIRLIPIKIFQEKKINPYPGLTLNIDNMLVKVVSVSGGRVLVDFNHPLAGKELVYEFVIKRKIESLEEKVKSIIDFFVGKEFKFSIKDNHVVFEIEEYFSPIIKSLNDRFKDILGCEMTVEAKKLAKEETKNNDKETTPQ
ncbi:MAG: peptidylprolyl isomerase [Candidatus Pacearchaeota archaeon]|jgi:FKBP-type peptidyl-prolyl cis-trans isomerase 2